MKLPFILAKRFVAGETFEESAPKVKYLNEKDIDITLDLLGENVKDKETAATTVDAYIDLLNGIKDTNILSTISIKLTMMGLDIDLDFCKDNLYKLMEMVLRILVSLIPFSRSI